jgi:hypothetical protein
VANIWRKGSLTTNPYHETAFQVLGITRDVISLAEIAQRVEERRQAVESMPSFYTLGERDLAPTDISSARQILFDPTRRILEELLEHKAECLQVDEIERLQNRLPMPDWPEEVPAPRHLAFLLRVVQEFALEILKSLPPVEVPAFPVDLTPIPPFGLPQGSKDDGLTPGD